MSISTNALLITRFSKKSKGMDLTTLDTDAYIGIQPEAVFVVVAHSVPLYAGT